MNKMVETSQVNYSIVKVDETTGIFTLKDKNTVSLVFSSGDNDVCLTISDYETGMEIIGILSSEIHKLIK